MTESTEQPTYHHETAHKPTGVVLYQKDTMQVIAPDHTDFPLESVTHLQITDPTLTSSELTLLDPTIPVRDVVRMGALGIAVAQQLVAHDPDIGWVNFNFHTRTPATVHHPDGGQYGQLTLDIHGRKLSDKDNWAKPPPTHGIWGVEPIPDDLPPEEATAPATKEEQKLYSDDPVERIGNSEYEHWNDHPTGVYQWDQGSRSYETQALTQLKTLMSSSEIDHHIEELLKTPLFSGEPVAEEFEQRDTDVELWKWGGYQLVTQRNPLTPEKDGIHMVLKLRPEPHTIWDNPQQTLEALAIGTIIARMLNNTTDLGELGDCYLDFNANWSMIDKRELPSDAVKEAIQQDTRAHLHIQLEKMNAQWELPPAPGTFGEHTLQSDNTITHIRALLNQPHGGLREQIATHL